VATQKLEIARQIVSARPQLDGLRSIQRDQSHDSQRTFHLLASIRQVGLFFWGRPGVTAGLVFAEALAELLAELEQTKAQVETCIGLVVHAAGSTDRASLALASLKILLEQVHRLFGFAGVERFDRLVHG